LYDVLSHFIVTEVALLKCHSCLPQSRDTPPALDWVEVRIAGAMIIQSNQIHFYITPQDGKSSWEILLQASAIHASQDVASAVTDTNTILLLYLICI
jgi:hypothetical protein